MSKEGEQAGAKAAHATILARHASRKHLATGGFHDGGSTQEKKKEIKTKLAGWKHFVA